MRTYTDLELRKAREFTAIGDTLLDDLFRVVDEMRTEQKLNKHGVSGSLPSTSEIEQKCDFVAMKDGYDITGGGTVADFTDGFMKGALWMKQVVESGGNDH